ncbi:pyridoxal-phosphate dependent enzyme [Acidaminobacter sp. JC074]|uniref:pyridoxal-phosphate dependent enzyme n=1 Tax=Acidaminobacter sp. JC074 TaxID=2530199 RepID=UPI001F0E2A40|nr:pyridoxal-phosphate dependent enzyme [Acidaminobacter sp. JC074]MCH4886540.1 pyridoxal-phosphate dependent enzyme [Acidaminobacter sp. JC074]
MTKYNLIDLSINEEKRNNALKRAKERNIIIPTFEQMRHPESIPDQVKEQLNQLGLWDIDPLNLFRITWHNEAKLDGGGFSGVNYIEIPEAISGVKAKIIALSGKYFPTGAHKVGAAFGCLVPRLVTGQFDPTTTKAVWPSTGNYCRGGAYDSTLLACDSIAILPEGMSKERFEWLESVAGETIKTVGTESNVKEIFDKCHELRNSGQDLMIFNQFDEFGNYLWHHEVTGPAIEEVLKHVDGKLHGYISCTGSGGTIAAGDYLKKKYPTMKIAASEALQCPTIYHNGFGDHRIEGIGDKHIPWIHNVKNTDVAMAIDDEATMNWIRLLNDPNGLALLKENGLDQETLDRLDLIGISGAANIIGAIKYAKYFELTEDDVVVTILTDSMEMYQSRVKELNDERGPLNEKTTYGIYERYFKGLDIDFIKELSYYDRKTIHNLKYYTWVEQQGKTYEEIQAQWYDDTYWTSIPDTVSKLDELIKKFNEDVKKL